MQAGRCSVRSNPTDQTGGPIQKAPTFKPPPPNSPAWLKHLTLSGGTPPTQPALIHTYETCYAGRECIIYGARLGVNGQVNAAVISPPAGYQLVVTGVAGPVNIKAPKGTVAFGGPVPVTLNAWNNNLLAFNSPLTQGTYTVEIKTSAGKTEASLTVKVLGVPPTTGQYRMVDEDDDGAYSFAQGGTDCDDTDPNRFPGHMEVPDATDHDEDCNPM